MNTNLVTSRFEFERECNALLIVIVSKGAP